MSAPRWPGGGSEDSTGYVSPGQVLMEILGNAFIPYVWRHESRMTERRRAELAEWDKVNAIEDAAWLAALMAKRRETRQRRASA